MTTTLDDIAVILDLSYDLEQKLHEQEPGDWNHVLGVMIQLKRQSVYREVYSHFASSFLCASIFKGKLAEATRLLERVLLPHLREINEDNYDMFVKSFRTMMKLSEDRGFRDSALSDSYTLSNNDRKVALMVARLRAVVMLGNKWVSNETRCSLLSNSGTNYTLMTYNTPLYLLISERVEDIDQIIELMGERHETDGDRLREMLSFPQAVSSGVL